jgi:SpoVK/Ycf46/Vps4 family AAA+-type ATPase
MDRRIMLRVDFEVPTAELRRRIWANHIPPEAPVSPDLDLDALAQQFEFTGGYIKNAVLSTLHEVLARKEEKPEIRQDDLLAACRNQLRQKLGAYSDRIVPQVPLASVILPPPLRERVEEMIDSTRHHATVFQEWGLGTRLTSGRGLAALFQGPPGTGKSLTAEAVAFELGKNLYRISLPAVVSKFVGETEKNIKAVFQAARDGQSVLFFDEADALFSKRTQVTGALDKYANMETNLLLIELEQFEGLVVLATNLVGNLDPAFERRIAYRLTFPFPDATAREAIWRGLLPPQMPVAEPVDFAYLGRKFELSGGHIKNAVLRAAYRAARETGHRRVVTTQLLARAAEEEQQGTFVQKARIGFGG